VIELTDLPALNASLNATSGLLVMAGLWSVKGRRIRQHKLCMVLATAVSGVFLASYVYYHFHAGHTAFTGQGWVRPVYFAILISHIVLAVAVVPLVLATVVLGLRNRLPSHRRLARWTAPIWLYVSVTGVVVYLMLYQIFPARP
jgi:putative membrane protein